MDERIINMGVEFEEDEVVYCHFRQAWLCWVGLGVDAHPVRATLRGRSPVIGEDKELLMERCWPSS